MQEKITIGEWCLKYKWVIAANVVSFIVFWIVSSSQAHRQTEIEKKLNEVTRQAEIDRAQAAHDKETDFALRLTGMRKTAEVTENGMINYYQQNLELIEHCRKVKTCQLPTTLAILKPLPSYVPVAAIYLEEKKKLIKED